MQKPFVCMIKKKGADDSTATPRSVEFATREELDSFIEWSARGVDENGYEQFPARITYTRIE